MIVNKLSGNALSTLLGETFVDLGITCAAVGIACDKNLGFGVGLNQVGLTAASIPCACSTSLMLI